MIKNLQSKGKTGESDLDNIWDCQNSDEKYLYNTFIKERLNQHEDDSKIRFNDANSYIIKKAIIYMYNNYVQKLSLLDVADHCYISSWHLSKLLNQYTGKGFFEIVNRIRIDKAKELLKGSTAKIQEISDMVGFQDVTHFSRIFKNYEGISPKDYRNSK